MNKKNIIIIIILLLIYAIIFMKFGWGLKCPIYELTGLYCPGCGITRMFVSLINLDIYQAFRYNPLVFILLVLYITYKLVSIFINIKLPKILPYIILVIVISYGFLRNIDAFSFLRPTFLG